MLNLTDIAFQHSSAEQKKSFESHSSDFSILAELKHNSI